MPALSSFYSSNGILVSYLDSPQRSSPFAWEARLILGCSWPGTFSEVLLAWANQAWPPASRKPLMLPGELFVFSQKASYVSSPRTFLIVILSFTGSEDSCRVKERLRRWAQEPGCPVWVWALWDLGQISSSVSMLPFPLLQCEDNNRRAHHTAVQRIKWVNMDEMPRIV